MPRTNEGGVQLRLRARRPVTTGAADPDALAHSPEL